MDGIENMKAFLMVSATRSFVDAARRLGTSPSVISKRVRQLEWQLGAPLLLRTTRNVQLTDLGERHLAGIQRLVRDYDDVTRGVLDRPEVLEGNLRISAPAAMTTVVLPGPLARFRTAHPAVTLEIVVVDRSVNPSEEGFDVSVMVLPASYDGVVEHVLCAYPRVACASPAYLRAHGAPAHPRDLMHHACIAFTPAGTTWVFHGHGGPTSITFRPALSSTDSRVINEMIRQGVGIGVTSEPTVRNWLHHGQVTLALPQHYRLADFAAKALVPQRRSHLARVQKFISHLAAELATLDRAHPSAAAASS